MRTHYKNPMIHQAFKTLERLSADKETRHLAEIREKALRDEISALSAAKEEGYEEGEKKGREEGREESKKTMAKKLLATKILTLEQITEVTELRLEEVRDLEKVERK